MTTISGPPLAVALNNQGLSKEEFRAALGFIRLAESAMTAVAYAAAGLFTRESAALVPQILPSLAIGVPLGGVLIRHVQPETFRRVCMSVDAWIVAFAISTLLRELHVVDGRMTYGVPVIVIALDAWCLYRFLTSARA